MTKLANALSALKYDRRDRKWFGYGVGTYYAESRKAFSRARRAVAREEIREIMAEMSHDDTPSMGEQQWLDMQEAEIREDWLVYNGEAEYPEDVDWGYLEYCEEMDRWEYECDDYDPRDNKDEAFRLMEQSQEDEAWCDDSDCSLFWRGVLQNEAEARREAQTLPSRPVDVYGDAILTDMTAKEWATRKVA